MELQSPTNVKYFELKNRPFECFISVENPVLGMALLIAFIVTVAVVSRI
ncbi:MAG: hypothetical protein JZD41_02405 [Thermoproteus sp.]|nr:hypothetical protein [Thermoproteus sp.]